MCFYYDGYCDVYKTNVVKARKPCRCCECAQPIAVGEEYHRVKSLYDGHWNTYRTCVVCQWFRARVYEAERKAGCGALESWPPHGELMKALSSGHGGEIGLVDMDLWHERKE